MPTDIDQIVEKVPPQNLEAEMAVLGSMLIDEDAVPMGVEILTPAQFYRDAHRKIFQAMVNLFTRQKAVDLVTVTEELKANNQLEAVGGASFLTGLTTVVPTAANIQHYAKIVKEKGTLRNLINAATQIVNAAGQIGGAIFNNFTGLRITNNLRPSGSAAPLGQYFGEFSSARDPRIIQVAAKIYF